MILIYKFVTRKKYNVANQIIQQNNSSTWQFKFSHQWEIAVENSQNFHQFDGLAFTINLQ